MENFDLFDKYIDKQLPQNEVQQLEMRLHEDAELQDLLDSLIISRKAIRLRALTIKVRGLHEQYIKELNTIEEEDNVRVLPITRIYSWATRIAATILVGVVGYQYVAVDNTRVYNEKFISYQLPTTRGSAEQKSILNALYLSGNFAAVTQQFGALQTKAPSDYFLTGVSYLQEKEYKSAVETFNKLREYNKHHTRPYFDQESDYYLALAYLGNGQVDEAYTLFKMIHDTPHHLFSKSITEVDLLKMNFVRLKM